MAKRIPPDACEFYVGLGPGRSYQAVADHYGFSKRSVVKLALKEDWQARVEEAEKRVRATSLKTAEETLSSVTGRHLKALRAIQAKALEALRAHSLDNAMDAVRALDLAIRQERTVLGEPSDRTAVSVEDTIKREYERWMVSPVQNGSEILGDEPDEHDELQ